MTRAAVVAITHGGGPMPVIAPMVGDKGHEALVDSLKTRVPKILRLGTPEAPQAIVVITPHWRPARPTVSVAAEPPLLHDFEPDFPPMVFEIQYKALGAPEMAEKVYQAFSDAGLESAKDAERGWDHGIFIPFILINPAGDVPLIQVSIQGDEDPATHFKMGVALEKLRNANVAVIGSGFASFHNNPVMKRLYFSDPASEEVLRWRKIVADWDDEIGKAVLATDPAERLRALERWRDIPNSYEIHPMGESEHLMPLLVCAGAAGTTEGKTFKDSFAGFEVTSFYWADDITV